MSALANRGYNESDPCEVIQYEKDDNILYCVKCFGDVLYDLSFSECQSLLESFCFD